MASSATDVPVIKIEPLSPCQLDHYPRKNTQYRDYCYETVNYTNHSASCAPANQSLDNSQTNQSTDNKVDGAGIVNIKDGSYDSVKENVHYVVIKPELEATSEQPLRLDTGSSADNVLKPSENVTSQSTNYKQSCDSDKASQRDADTPTKKRTFHNANGPDPVRFSIHNAPSAAESPARKRCRLVAPVALSPEQRALHDAVAESDHVGLELLLSRAGAVDVNVVDAATGQTALHAAVRRGDLTGLKLLLRFGADLRLCDRDGWSPLHLACWAGHHNVTRYLLTTH